MKRIKLFGFLLLSFSVIILVANTLSIHAEDEENHIAVEEKKEESTGSLSNEVAEVPAEGVVEKSDTEENNSSAQEVETAPVASEEKAPASEEKVPAGGSSEFEE